MTRRSIILIFLLLQLGKLFAQAPVITSFSPQLGPVGTNISISGSTLDSTSSITIGNVPAIIISNTGSQLVCMAMPGTLSGRISVTTSTGTATSTSKFSIIATPYPSMQLGSKLIGTGTGNSQGYTVAMSADGTTAVVSSILANAIVGASWIYVRNGNTWIQQGTELTGSGASGGSDQGRAVAISADGNTIAIGGPEDDEGVGAFWIFVRDNGTWSQQGSKFIPSDVTGEANVGNSLSLSADGNTLIVGGQFDNLQQGAAWIFSRNNGIWAQQGGKMVVPTAAPAGEGTGVALSADGKTAAISTPYYNTSGAIWFYSLTGGKWNKAASIVGADKSTVGSCIALNADGSILIAGAAGYHNSAGTAFVFTRTNGVWNPAGIMLNANGAASEAQGGSSVNLSADGKVAMISGFSESNQGGWWIFVNNNGSWKEQGNELVGIGSSGPAVTGSSVSMSSDGNTAIAGGYLDGLTGGAWILASFPISATLPATSINTSGATLNGTVNADGSNTVVSFEYSTNPDLSDSINVKVSSGTSPIPAGSATKTFASALTGLTPGTVYYYRIEGTNTNGTSNGAVLNFTTVALPPTITSITPASGPPGTLITITGTSLNALTAFKVGNTPAIVVSDSRTTVVGLVVPGVTGGTISLSTSAGNAISSTGFTVTPTPYPTAQAGAKLVGAGNIGAAGLGASVSISADGSTVIVGAPADNNNIGAAWIYVRNGDSWAQQGLKLVGRGYSGGLPNQGSSVALSADGNTAAVGASNDNNGTGAVWIYTRNAGVWTQQGVKLVGADFTGALIGQGASVVLSADGNTVFIGAPNDSNFVGAAWVFTRIGNVWTQQGSKLVGSGSQTVLDSGGGPHQGGAVALSADGNTAMVGGTGDNSGLGAVWIYTRNAGIWTQQGSKLVGSGTEDTFINQGCSIALSADGNTAVFGGRTDGANRGAAWVFSRSNGVWTQQGGKLNGTGAIGIAFEGTSVGISADGNTIVVGGFADNAKTGAIWTFVKTEGVWSQQGAKLVGSGNTGPSQQGQSLALSANGNYVITGGNSDNSNQGAAWLFDASPIAVTIPATDITTSSATLNGTVDDNGNTTTVSFEYSTANDLSGSTVVMPASAPNPILPGTGQAAFNFALSSLNEKTTYYYRINGSNTNGLANGAIYSLTTDAGPPEIDSFSPASGSPGTLVTIKGANLLNLTNFSIGGKTAIAVTNTETVITGMVMPGAATGLIAITTNVSAVSSKSSFTVMPTRYPVRQQGNQLIGSGSGSNSVQGLSTAISADGNTAVSGGGGAIWIYTRTDTVWTQQGPAIALPGGLSSNTVAISADGNTLLTGDEDYNNSEGCAAVFTRSGNSWSQQGSLLIGTGNIGAAWEGSMVALSADGNTAVVGGPGDNNGLGAVWIFTRVGNTWTQQGSKLIGIGTTGLSPPQQSLALSADGSTLIIGNCQDNNNRGSAIIYYNNGGTWSLQGGKLIGTGGIGTSRQGTAVALSADGNIAISGGGTDNGGIGAAWIFKRSNGTWAQQGDKLVGSSPVGQPNEGNAVALSADGSTAIISGPYDEIGFGVEYTGASWVFTQNEGVWSQRGIKLIASGTTSNPDQGLAISLSADGSTLITGGPLENNYVGEVVIFSSVPSPVITSFTPSTGISGTIVTITGTALTGTTSVSFGGVRAKSFTVKSATQLTAVVDSGASGNVTITTLAGNSTLTGFTYVPVPTINAQSTTTFITGGSVILAASPLSGYNYQWMKGGVNIAHASNSTFSATQTGVYTVAISLNGVRQVSVDSITVNSVFTLPPDNFKLTITSATCDNSNNGSMSITAKQNLAYTATITGNGLNATYPFNESTTISNLAAGNYSVCITVAGQSDYQQCFGIVITQPADLSVYSTIDAENKTITIALTGGDKYNINLNGHYYSTTESTVTLPLVEGNNDLVVSTDKVCQGTVERLINISGQITPYPVPFQNTLNVNIGLNNVSNASVEIRNVTNGNVVFSKQYVNQSGVLQLDVSGLSNGIYALHLLMDQSEKVFKIIKQ